MNTQTVIVLISLDDYMNLERIKRWNTVKQELDDILDRILPPAVENRVLS